MKKTALVIGATGLVGNELVHQLLADDRFGAVLVFVRRSMGISHSKLQEFIINFDEPQSWSHLVKGDVLFSALGTTLKKAGSKEAQYKIDHDYQYNFAQAAAQNQVPVYVLVSSAMASVSSRIFYTRMKGELERDIQLLPFQAIHIMQPGMLQGNRKENRPGEKVGLYVIRLLNKMGIALKQKPIPAGLVAKAMINVSFKNDKRINVYALTQVFTAAEQ
ncbi:MAG TPA: NAD(P)H-binding protein [Flavisolibacter sp.]|nr:NAD(P)H-binding protein [Flavisolibacter sp.]